MNRWGLMAVPFLKMSFETSMKFLTQATVRQGDNTESLAQNCARENCR